MHRPRPPQEDRGRQSTGGAWGPGKAEGGGQHRASPSPPCGPQSAPGRPGKAGSLAAQASDSRLRLAGLNLFSASKFTSNLSLSKLSCFLTFFSSISLCQTEEANIPMSEGFCCKNIKFIHLTQDPTRRISKYITALIRHEDTGTHVRMDVVL